MNILSHKLSVAYPRTAAKADIGLDLPRDKLFIDKKKVNDEFDF